MPKMKSDVNKSAAVKEILAKNPDAPVKEIVARLASEGIEISENYVYSLKKKRKGGRPTGSKAVAQSSAKASNSATITIEDIEAVKALAEKLGAEKLHQLADVLAK